MTDVGDKSRVGVHLGCTFGESAITMRINFGKLHTNKLTLKLAVPWLQILLV